MWPLIKLYVIWLFTTQLYQIISDLHPRKKSQNKTKDKSISFYDHIINWISAPMDKELIIKGNMKYSVMRQNPHMQPISAAFAMAKKMNWTWKWLNDAYHWINIIQVEFEHFSTFESFISLAIRLLYWHLYMKINPILWSLWFSGFLMLSKIWAWIDTDI